VNCWAIIPIKASAESKSRLADALSPEERATLVSAMLERVVGAAQDARTISRLFLVGPARDGMTTDIPLLHDPGQGLNPAVQSAVSQACDKGSPDRVMIIAADLPSVTSHDLELLSIAPADTLAIAPDRHETGTNAISLPIPAALEFRFAFGPDSFAKHQQEARRLGLKIETILSQGLEHDIDEPEDLPNAQAALADPR